MIRGLEEPTLLDTTAVTRHTTSGRVSVDNISSGHGIRMESSPTSELSAVRPSSWSSGHVPTVLPNGPQPPTVSEETDAFQFMIAGSLAQARCKPRQPALMMKSSQIAQFERQQKPADYCQVAQQAALSPPSAESAAFTKPWLFAVQSPPATNAHASDAPFHADRRSQPARSAAAAAANELGGDKLLGLHKGFSIDLPVSHGTAYASAAGPAAAAAAERTEKMLQLHHSYSGAQLRSPLYGQVGPAALSLSDGWKTPPGRTSTGTGEAGGCSDPAPVHFDADAAQMAGGQSPGRAPEGVEAQLNPASAAVATTATLGWRMPTPPRAGTVADRQQSPHSGDDAGSHGQQRLPQRSPETEFFGRQQSRVLTPPAMASPNRGPALQGDGPPLSRALPVVHVTEGTNVPVDPRDHNEQLQLLLLHQHQLANAAAPQNVAGSMMHVARLVRIGSDGSIDSKEACDTETVRDCMDAAECCEPGTIFSKPVPLLAAYGSQTTAGKGADIACHTLGRIHARAESPGNYENIIRASAFTMHASAPDPNEEPAEQRGANDDGLYAPSTVSRRSHKRTMSAGAALAHHHQRAQLHRAVTQFDPAADSRPVPTGQPASAISGATATTTSQRSDLPAGAPTAAGNSTAEAAPAVAALTRAQSASEKARILLGRRPSVDSVASMGNRMPGRGAADDGSDQYVSLQDGRPPEESVISDAYASRRHTFSESSKRPLPVARAVSVTSSSKPKSPLSADCTANGRCAVPEVAPTRLSSRKLPVAEVSPFTMTTYTSLHPGTEQASTSTAASAAGSEAGSSADGCSGASLSAPTSYSNAQVRTVIASDEESIHPSHRPPRKYSLPPPSSDDGSGDEAAVKSRVRDYENMRGRNCSDCENAFDPKVGHTGFGLTGDLNDSTYRGQLRRASEYQFRRSSGSISASPPMSMSQPSSTATATTSAAVPQSQPTETKMDPTTAHTAEAAKPQPRPRPDVDLRPVPPPKPVPKSIYRWCSSSNLQRKSTSEENPPTAATGVGHQARSPVGKDDPRMTDGANRAAQPAHPVASAVTEHNVAAAPATTRRAREPVPAPRLSIGASAMVAPPLPERRVHAKVAEITFPPPPPESPQDEDLSTAAAAAASSRLDKRASSSAMAAVIHARSGSLNSADCEVAAVLMASAGPLSMSGSSAFKPITGDASPHQSSPSANIVGRPGSSSQACELGQSASPDSSAAAATANAVVPSLHAVLMASRKGADGTDVAPARLLKPRWPSPHIPDAMPSTISAATNDQLPGTLGSDGKTEALATAAAGRQNLLAAVRQQLEALRIERKRCEADMLANNSVGLELTAVLADRCGERQAAKYSSFIEDSEKVTRLLLRVTRRLARVEGEASGAGQSSGAAMRPGTSLSSPAELRAAETRREQLQMQHDDACLLRDGIERQRITIEETVLGPTLDAEQLELHASFLAKKLQLVGELFEIDDKVGSCEERLAMLEWGAGNTAAMS